METCPLLIMVGEGIHLSSDIDQFFWYIIKECSSTTVSLLIILSQEEDEDETGSNISGTQYMSQVGTENIGFSPVHYVSSPFINVKITQRAFFVRVLQFVVIFNICFIEEIKWKSCIFVGREKSTPQCIRKKETGPHQRELPWTARLCPFSSRGQGKAHVVGCLRLLK